MIFYSIYAEYAIYIHVYETVLELWSSTTLRCSKVGFEAVPPCQDWQPVFYSLKQQKQRKKSIMRLILSLIDVYKI